MNNLKIAGNFLIFNGAVLLFFGLFFAVIALFFDGLSFGLAAILPIVLFFVWCVALLKVGKGIKTGNSKFKTPGLVVAVISIFTSPLGIICGIGSLVFQLKGKESFEEMTD